MSERDREKNEYSQRTETNGDYNSRGNLSLQNIT